MVGLFIVLSVTFPDGELAYGTTEKLSKFWMPLDKYIETTMEGLRRGDKHYILWQPSLDAYQRFEKGKDELNHVSFYHAQANW